MLQLIDTIHFDTTNTNMGKHTGAFIKLQDIIGRPLLWMVCQKHVREVYVGKEFDILKIEVKSRFACF